MKLTKEIVIEIVLELKLEWEKDEDWWYGSTVSYDNALLGWDVNIDNNRAIIYALKKDENGHLVIENEKLFSFLI